MNDQDTTQNATKNTIRDDTQNAIKDDTQNAIKDEPHTEARDVYINTTVLNSKCMYKKCRNKDIGVEKLAYCGCGNSIYHKECFENYIKEFDLVASAKCATCNNKYYSVDIISIIVDIAKYIFKVIKNIIWFITFIILYVLPLVIHIGFSYDTKYKTFSGIKGLDTATYVIYAICTIIMFITYNFINITVNCCISSSEENTVVFGNFKSLLRYFKSSYMLRYITLEILTSGVGVFSYSMYFGEFTYNIWTTTYTRFAGYCIVGFMLCVALCVDSHKKSYFNYINMRSKIRR